MRRKGFIVLAMGMILGLAGCSPKDAAPADAVTVIERYAATEGARNYNAAGTLNATVAISSDGMDVSVPVNMQFTVDVSGKLAHASVIGVAEALGETTNINSEAYVRGDRVYMHDIDTDEWTAADFDVNLAGFLDKGAFGNAELLVDKKEKAYVVTQPVADLVDTDMLESALSDAGYDMSELFDGADDMFGDSVVTYVFDTDYNLVSCTLSDFSYFTSVNTDMFNMDVSFSLDFAVTFSRYGEIDASTLSITQSLMDSLDGSVVDDDATTDAGFSDEDRAMISDTDLIGAYNGVFMGLGPNDWSVFANDGWVISLGDEEPFYGTAVNDAYPGVNFTVMGDMIHVLTEGELERTGFYGYSIDVSECTGDKPYWMFNGLTWGAAGEDIVRVYGEPELSFDASNGTMYQYTPISGITLTFYTYTGSGLQGAALSFE